MVDYHDFSFSASWMSFPIKRKEILDINVDAVHVIFNVLAFLW